MMITKLEEIERKVKENASNNRDLINNYQKDIGKSGLKKGRIRPRDLVEQKILDSFGHK